MVYLHAVDPRPRTVAVVMDAVKAEAVLHLEPGPHHLYLQIANPNLLPDRAIHGAGRLEHRIGDETKQGLHGRALVALQDIIGAAMHCALQPPLGLELAIEQLQQLGIHLSRLLEPAYQQGYTSNPKRDTLEVGLSEETL